MQRRIKHFVAILIDHNVEQSGSYRSEEKFPTSRVSFKIWQNPRYKRAIPRLPIYSESRLERILVKLVKVVQCSDPYGCSVAGSESVFVIHPTESELRHRCFVWNKHRQRRRLKTWCIVNQFLKKERKRSVNTWSWKFGAKGESQERNQYVQVHFDCHGEKTERFGNCEGTNRFRFVKEDSVLNRRLMSIRFHWAVGDGWKRFN